MQHLEHRHLVLGGLTTVFTAKERECLSALVDCLVPADSLGPSASDAGVVVFIDSQLDGDYGAGKGTYLPAADQAALDADSVSMWAPRLFYKKGLAALDEVANRIAGGEFARLSERNRHELLIAIERKAVGHPWIALFLDQALLNTMEGYFSDPIHGGNKNADGWKMVGFPGCGHDYRKFVGKNLPVSQQVPVQTIADFQAAP